jgi:hypothetical protein
MAYQRVEIRVTLGRDGGFEPTRARSLVEDAKGHAVRRDGRA